MMKPSYLSIKEELEEMVRAGELRIGEKLPAEAKMAEHFGVSRETFRSAVKLLVEEGKLLVKHGVGTFVTNPLPSISSSLERLQSVGSMIKLAGLEEGEQQVKVSTKRCNKSWAKLLDLAEGDLVTVIKRIRTANNEPVFFSLNILPQYLVGEAFKVKEFSGSLFEFLNKECNIDILLADTELVVPLADDEYAQKIIVEPETTVLLMKQLHYDETNRPILYSLDYWRNDIFSFWIRRRRQQ